MTAVRTRLAPVRLGLVAVLSAIVGFAGCRRGGTVAEELQPRIVPYPGYYQAQIDEEVFLLADLDEKQRFDLAPAALTYTEFISRTGQRVYISNARAELVARIEVAYERAVDTELMPVDAALAPRPDSPPTLATRRSDDAGQEQPATLPATRSTAQPSTQPSTVPIDRRGPTGDPQPTAD